MLFYQWGSKWPPLHGMGNITTFIYSHLPHSTVDLSSLYHSVRTAGNWAMSMGLAIPFCQTATQTLWERKRKKKTTTPLFTAHGPSLGLGELENSCKHTEQTLSCDQPGKTGAPAHDTDWHHSLHAWPEPAWVNKCTGKSWKRPLQTGPGVLCPLSHAAHLLWQRDPPLLSGVHPDSRILTEGLSRLGIVHSKSRHRQHSLKLLCWGHVGK